MLVVVETEASKLFAKRFCCCFNLLKTEKCFVTGLIQTSRLPIHIHCVRRAIVWESLTPLHLVHSTVQQLLRCGEGYCHVNRKVSAVI